MRARLTLLIFTLMFLGCNDPEDALPVFPSGQAPDSFGQGLLVLNEGNFDFGVGTLDWLPLDQAEAELSQQVFFRVNDRYMGNVGQSITAHDSLLVLVVNNSGKAEILHKKTLQSIATVEGLHSPRQVAFAGVRMFVTNLFGRHIQVVDTRTWQVEGEIFTGTWTEDIMEIGGLIYATSSRAVGDTRPGGQALLKIDPAAKAIAAELELPTGAKQLAQTEDGKLSVLCDGGLDPDAMAHVVEVDLASFSVVQDIAFPWTFDSFPYDLVYDTFADRLLLLAGAVYEVDTDRGVLTEVVANEAEAAYSLAVDPTSGEIYVGDAQNFSLRGSLRRYSPEGQLVASYPSGIIPGDLLFLNRVAL